MGRYGDRRRGLTSLVATLCGGERWVSAKPLAMNWYFASLFHSCRCWQLLHRASIEEFCAFSELLAPEFRQPDLFA
jgi:hypothetical protein